MKKQFDIKYRHQIESGEYKVVTRDGHPARIICYDRKGKFNIIALVDYGFIEIKQEYTPDGCLLHDKSEHRLDLFVTTPEPELTEFEMHVQAVMRNSGLIGCTECYKDIDTVKTTSKSLLEYAKAELQPKYDATNDAIDGEICEVEDDSYSMNSYTHLELFFEDEGELLEKKGFKEGDKVQIIIKKV